MCVHCLSIVERGAPATAIHVRDIVKQIYGYAILHGEKIANPPMTSGRRRSLPFDPANAPSSPPTPPIAAEAFAKVSALAVSLSVPLIPGATALPSNASVRPLIYPATQ